MTQFAIERPGNEFLGMDDTGVAFATDGAHCLRVTYQPIFTAGRGGSLKFYGLRAGVEGTAEGLMQFAAPLALKNFWATGANAADLYIDRAVGLGWSSTTLAGHVAEDRGVSFGRVHIEAIAEKVVAAAAQKLFRSALAYERDDCWLETRIAEHRPSLIRIEGEWIAELAEHRSTRALLTTLVSMLRQRGIKTLFEGLDNDRLVGFAIDCGADRLQGNALGRAFAAGERVADHVVGLGDNVVSVAFGHRRRSGGA